MGTIAFSHEYKQRVSIDGGARWNRDDKASGTIISNGGLTMQSSSSAGGGVRSTTSRYKGKFYLEITLDLCPTAYTGSFGFANAGRSLTDGVGYLLTGFLLTHQGWWYQGDNSSISLYTVAQGDTVGFIMDLDLNRVWVVCSNSNVSEWNSWGSINGNTSDYGAINPASPAFNMVMTSLIGSPVYLMALGIGTDNGGNSPFGCTLNTRGPYLNPNYSTIAGWGYGFF